jgi:hypothetical protein
VDLSDLGDGLTGMKFKGSLFSPGGRFKADLLDKVVTHIETKTDEKVQ